MTRFQNQARGTNNHHSWRRALLGGTALIGSLALSSQGLAQDQDSAASEEEPVEEVIVTGSRIKRSGFESAAPMDVIAAEDAVPLGYSDVASLLRSNTAAAGSSQVTAAISTAWTMDPHDGGQGVETLNLRGLGANRTLVLLNGRRAGPAGVRGAVSAFDFNVIPLSGIERVEILKDGASSIYGSDAVAGVVNIITKKEEGAVLDAYASVPQRGGGEEYRINGSYGIESDRGNFRITADYYRREELAKGDRDYFACGEDYIFDPVTGERDDIIDPRTGEYRCADWAWGHVWVYDYAYAYGDGSTNVNWDSSFHLLQYDFDGSLAANNLPTLEELSPATPGNPFHMRIPDGWYPVGYDRLSEGLLDFQHPFQNEETLIPQTERFTIMAEGEYEISNSVTMYAEALFNRRENYENHYSQVWNYVYNDNWSWYSYYEYYYDEYDGVNDGFNDDLGGVEGSLVEGWTGMQWLDPVPVIDHFDQKTTVDYFRAVLGFRGQLGDFAPSWDFDTSFQYSKSDASYWNQYVKGDAVWSQNFAAWGGGYSVLDGTCSTSVAYPNCVDYDWMKPDFLQGNWTQEERDYFLADQTGTTIYEQYSFDASITGELFDMPAGPVSGAFGGHYRYDSLDDTPGAASLAGNVWGAGAKQRTVGDHNTKAFFGEVEIPLFRGKPLMEMLSLNLSGRYTDVSSYGDGATYKGTLNWQVTPEFRIRATRGTSFRTPALFELFVQSETASVRQADLDPCTHWGANLAEGNITQRTADNCAADGAPPAYQNSITGTVITSGGAGTLDAETSTSTTLGFVWSPNNVDLRVSVDYFRIEVRDEVAQLGGVAIVHGCYDSEDFANDPLCDLFDRDPWGAGGFPGQITEVRDSYINIATQQNRGLDIAATYGTELPWGVDLRIETQHTFQFRDTVEKFIGIVEDFNGLVGDPKWVGNLSFTAEKGPWTATWGMRFVGKASDLEDNGGNDVTYWSGLPAEEDFKIVVSVPNVMYHSISIAREMPNGFRATLGVANLFDKEPPQVSAWPKGRKLGRSAFYSQYDWEGRRFFLNITKEF